MTDSNYRWDKFSDQPYPISNRAYKRAVRIQSIPAFFKTIAVTLLVMPLASLLYYFSKPALLPVRTTGMIGLCVNADKEPELSLEMVRALNVKKLSIRLPLHDIENIDRYLEFANQFESYDLLFVILQDRRHIEDAVKLEASLSQIFKKFKHLSVQFQIGNAVNRTKWGFVSVDEYLQFFETAMRVRDEHYPQLRLLGSSIIDFEIYAIVRSLFNFSRLKYDGMASLLYVDRRGAPENKQFNFNLLGKIRLIRSIARLSNKAGDRLLITESNWPIEFTSPYAPALDDVWVNESDYANFMVRYYLLAMSTGMVETIYWHQLVAPGYGLVDNRDGNIVKRPAFECFSTMLRFLAEAEIHALEQTGEQFVLKAKNEVGLVWALWSAGGGFEFQKPEGMTAFDMAGAELSEGPLKISQSVVYFQASSTN